MIRLLKCSDEAFMRIIYACIKHYGSDEEETLEMMFGEGVASEEILEDRTEAINCVVALMESMD